MDRYNSGLLKMIKQESDHEMNLTHMKVEVKSVISHVPSDNLSVVNSHRKFEHRQSVPLPVPVRGHADSSHSIPKAGYKRRIHHLRVKSRRASDAIEHPSHRAHVMGEANKMNANNPEIQKLVLQI